MATRCLRMPAPACGTASGTTPAGTFDGNTVRLLVDGKEIGLGTVRGGAPVGYGTPAGNTTLGAYGGTCDLSLTGDLDEVSIWKKALPVAEIWDRARVILAPH